MPTTGNVTANEISVTLQAQQEVEQFVNVLRTQVAQVAEAGTQLKSSGMVTTAGQAWANVIEQWNQDAQDMINTMNWYAGQLGDTAKQLQASNQQSYEMAASLPPMGAF